MSYGQIVSFIWAIADLIRDSFRRGEYQNVINLLIRGKIQRERDRLIFVTGVAKGIRTVKADFVSAVPEQALLPVIEIEIDKKVGRG